MNFYHVIHDSQLLTDFYVPCERKFVMATMDDGEIDKNTNPGHCGDKIIGCLGKRR
jgi:hypothetical protein